MSIAIGILCRIPDCVLIAADSQWGELNYGTVSYGTKIEKVKFNENDVVVAIAGNPSTCKRIIEIAREEAEHKNITNARSVTETFEEAVRAYKKNLSQNDLWAVEEGAAQSTLILGFLEKNIPKLYAVGTAPPATAREPDHGRHFITAGVGGILADYLMCEWAKDKLLQDEAAVVATSVIHRVKQHQKLFCGGDTNISIVTSFSEGVSVGYDIPTKRIALMEKKAEKRMQMHNKKMLWQWTADVRKIAAEDFRKNKPYFGT